MADKPPEQREERADELVRNTERDSDAKEPQQDLPEEIQQELEDTDRFQATDN
jgi:hypothetical protein